MEIGDVEIISQRASELNLLLNKEWPDIGDFETTKYGINIPNPIAVTINNQLVGGLSFTSYKEPSGVDIVIWINTVLVVHKFRRQGIASRLIQASHKSVTSLYALTDIPALYTNIGWQIVKKDSSGTIVKYAKNT